MKAECPKCKASMSIIGKKEKEFTTFCCNCNQAYKTLDFIDYVPTDKIGM